MFATENYALRSFNGNTTKYYGILYKYIYISSSLSQARPFVKANFQTSIWAGRGVMVFATKTLVIYFTQFGAEFHYCNASKWPGHSQLFCKQGLILLRCLFYLTMWQQVLFFFFDNEM